MQAASNSSLPVGLSIAKLAADYIQLRQDSQGASSANAQGPYNQLLAQLDQAFKPFLDQAFADSQTNSDQQATLNASDVPTPYSTDNIPSDVQNNPMSQFPPEDINRFQNLASNSAMMASAYRTTDSNVVVRDHRHRTISLPPAAPPPAYYPLPAAPPSSGHTGTNFTSGADMDRVDQLSSDLEAAKQNALKNPKDANAQIAFQDAAQALQLMVNMLLQQSQMLASMADKAIQNSKVNVS